MNLNEGNRNRLVEAARQLVSGELKGDGPRLILIVTQGRAMVQLDIAAGAECGVYPGADGPGADNLFWWSGRSIRMRPREWKMVAFLWATKSATLAEVRRAVWGHVPPSDATVRVCMCQANARLLAIGCTTFLSQSNGSILIKS